MSGSESDGTELTGDCDSSHNDADFPIGEAIYVGGE